MTLAWTRKPGFFYSPPFPPFPGMSPPPITVGLGGPTTGALFTARRESKNQGQMALEIIVAQPLNLLFLCLWRREVEIVDPPAAPDGAGRTAKKHGQRHCPWSAWPDP